MLAVRASTNHDKTPVERCSQKIGDQLAIYALVDLSSRDRSLNQGVGTLPPCLLHGTDRVGQLRLASNLSMKIS